MRDTSRAPFRSLPMTLENGRLRVVVSDNARNRREGLGTKLRVSARAVRRGGRGRWLKVRGGRVKVPNRRAVRVRGRLSLIRGASVGGAEVLATTSVVRGGSARPAGRVVTSRSGRLSPRLPAGPSRVLQLSSPGSGAALGATGRLSVRVPGTYPTRALIRRQGSFPFEAGHSRAVRVRIR